MDCEGSEEMSEAAATTDAFNAHCPLCQRLHCVLLKFLHNLHRDGWMHKMNLIRQAEAERARRHTMLQNPLSSSNKRINWTGAASFFIFCLFLKIKKKKNKSVRDER